MAKRWYVVHVYSGFEKKVASVIKETAEKRNLGERVEDVLVPTESVIEVRRGQKINSEQKFFPGYILMKADMNEEVWHMVKNTPKVTGFLGGGGNKPQPITEAEALRLLKQIEEGSERPRSGISFEIGEQVRVCDGPFNSFNGNVEEIDTEKNRLKVLVSIFGRSTPVELEFTQVEKI